MRWRGAGDVAASQGLADGQAIAAKHRQGDAARHLASERCMGRGRGENKNRRLSACVRPELGWLDFRVNVNTLYTFIPLFLLSRQNSRDFL